MKKQLLAMISVMCTVATPALAASATHFEDVTQYGTTVAPNSPPNCPAGQVLTFSGTAYSCTSAVQITCPAGQLLNSVSAAGVPTCITSDVTCPAGQAMKSITGGVPACVNANTTCPAGQVLQSIAGGVPTCLTMTVVPPPPASGCPAGQVQTGIDAAGGAVCGAPPLPALTCVMVSSGAVPNEIVGSTTATCPAGTFVLTGGGSCSVANDAICKGIGGSGYGELIWSAPTANGWVANCKSDNTALFDCSTAVAMCCHF